MIWNRLTSNPANLSFQILGAVDKVSGDKIAKVTHIQSILGSSECNIQGFQLVNKADELAEWDTIHYAPEQGGVEFQERTPGVYEMVFIREPATEELHSIWQIFPEATEYKTKDMFSKHPTLPNRWKFESRTDDLIAFANASKYNPLAYEEFMVSNPLVRSAIMAGTQRPCPALLVELSEPVDANDTQRFAEALDSVWQTVQEANKVAPKHAQVRKELVMLASPAKPFERAAKGTPVRQRTLKLYDSEIDALYKAVLDVGAPTAALVAAAAANGSVAQEKLVEQEALKEDTLVKMNELLTKTNESLSKMTDTMSKMYEMFARIEKAQAARGMNGSVSLPVGSH